MMRPCDMFVGWPFVKNNAAITFFSLTVGKMFCKIDLFILYCLHWYFMCTYVCVILIYICANIICNLHVYIHIKVLIFISAIVAISPDIFSEIINMNSFQILHPSSSDHHVHLLEENFILISNKTEYLWQIRDIIYNLLC